MSKIKFSRKLLAIPYGLFLLVFVIVPLLLIIYYAFTNEAGQFTFGNLISFFSSKTNISTFLISVIIGLGNTLLCLLIGYPIAYILSKKDFKYGALVILLFIMPMWINFVLRTAATRDLLYWIGINGGEHPYLTTMIGMVYNYIPFVILPLYTTMIKMDQSLVEASMDLGATPAQTFVRTIIPMTKPGIISAVLMVFMPTMSSYVISDVMGERQITLIGNSIQIYFDKGMWHLGSLIALIMLVIIGLIMYSTRNMEREDNVRGSIW